MSNHNDMTSHEMTEYTYLIHLLRCGIHDLTPMEVPGNISFEKVFQYAMDHDVANLAFYAVDRLEKKPETDLYHRWELRRDLALVRDMNQDFARQELAQAFDSQGILYKELQGTVLKKLYPRPEYRTMSDIDFVVEKSSLDRCEKILQQLGYRCSYQEDFEIDGFRRPDIVVELHTVYFSPYTRYHSIMNTPDFHRELTEVERYTELYLYNVLHIAKHYFSSGCGIRRVLDMYYIDQCYGDKIDSEYVSLMLKEIGLTEFSVELIRLARAWFGKPDESATVSAMEQSIVEAGLHGKRETYISRRVQSMSAKESISFGSKLKYLLSRVFPNFRVMEIKYPIVKKVKILYPLCAIHRIFRMLLGKNRKASVLDLRLVLQTEKKDDI